jgi:hypothetical protein
MSKRRHRVTNRKPTAVTIQAPPRRPESVSVQQAGTGQSWWLPVMGVALLVVVGLLFALPALLPSRPLGLSAAAPPGPVPPEPWKVRSAEDQVVDDFVKLHQAGDPRALQLLGPAPEFGDEVVKEDEAERRETDHFLRSSLEFVDIWRGEPDGQGGQKPVPGRYTLVAKGGVFAPGLQVDYGNGKASPRQRTMHNPDLIVEVRDGKVRGVRADVHTGPDR